MTNAPDNKDPLKVDKPEGPEEPHEKKEGREFGGLFNFARTNTKDAIAYIILIIGIILLFFERFSGELLIGVIFGLYFSTEIQGLFRNFNEFIEELGAVRGVVLGVTILALFISAPGVFIGAVLAVIIKYLFTADKT